MLLAWNTLMQSATYLSRETYKEWSEHEVIQACLDFGILPHMQMRTEREDVPGWMRENEMVELPFNIDLLRFLGGEGLIQIVRYQDIIYRFKPGIKVERKELRLSKSALCELITRFKTRKEELKQEKQNKQGGINREWQARMEIMAEEDKKSGKKSSRTKTSLASRLSKEIGVEAATIERNTRKTW